MKRIIKFTLNGKETIIPNWKWDFTQLYDKGSFLDILDFVEELLEAQAKQIRQEERKEIVICAAVKSADGKVFRGHRHSDCFDAWIKEGREKGKLFVEGFITSKNRFVDRREARQLQDLAGIPSADREGYSGDLLWSEDLY